MEDDLSNMIDGISKNLRFEPNPLSESVRQSYLNPTHGEKIKIQEKIRELEASLDYLRVCVKYQVFDLEATRRERNYVVKIAERLEDENRRLRELLDENDIDFERD